MNNSTLMKIPDSINDGTDNFPCFFFSVNNFLCNLVIEFPTRQKFKYEIDMFLIRVIVIKLNNIWMLYILHYMNFPLQLYFLLFIHLLPMFKITYFLITFIATT